MDGQAMKHLRDNNISYINHCVFAGKIGLTLIFRGILFLLHAVLPVVDLPARWNLEDTARKLTVWNNSTQGRKK